MAKKKARKVRTRTITKIKRVGKKAKPMAGLLGAGLYGAARARVSTFLAQYTNQVPLGNISDEVGMMVVSMIAEKQGNKVPVIGKFVKEAGRAGKVIEAARIGEAIATGSLGGFGQQPQQSATSSVMIIG